MAQPNPLQGWLMIGVFGLITSVILFSVFPPWAAILVTVTAVLLAGIGCYLGVQKLGWGFLADVGRAVDALASSLSREGSAGRKAKVVRPSGYWTSKLIEAVGGQCEIQACQKISHLQVHHIDEHAQGGSNRLNNLIVVCPNHHQACGSGSINKTRQRAIIGRKSRFTDTEFPRRWQQKVIATRSTRRSEDSGFALDGF